MGAAVFLVTHNVLEAEKSVDRLAVIANGEILAEGTPSSFKLADRGKLRLQLMLAPGIPTPELPPLVLQHSRVGNVLMSVIEEDRAGDGISWAQRMLSDGVAEEYALGATTLEDAYIRLTGDVPEAAVRVES
jgi:ABC-2 type transport system ATP-binding protein